MVPFLAISQSRSKFLSRAKVGVHLEEGKERNSLQKTKSHLLHQMKLLLERKNGDLGGSWRRSSERDIAFGACERSGPRQRASLTGPRRSTNFCGHLSLFPRDYSRLLLLGRSHGQKFAKTVQRQMKGGKRDDEE